MVQLMRKAPRHSFTEELVDGSLAHHEYPLKKTS